VSQLSDFGYLRIWQVLQLFPVGKSTWWAGVKDGRFPKPVKLGPRTTAWRATDIQEFLEARGQQPTVQQEFRA
jgi:predicted DNA-binding transcriptional regulator AlpA